MTNPDNQLLSLRRRIEGIAVRDSRERHVLNLMVEMLNYISVLEEKFDKAEKEWVSVANDFGDHLLKHEEAKK